MSPPAEDPLDELFAIPLADFVKARDRQAAELRKQGDKARAAEIKALAKPTPAAWAVNQAARAAPRAVQRLLEASDRMARLQLRAGDPEARRRFEEATADHRRSMDELVEQAAGALREAGHAGAPAVLERVANNLRWGALDEDVRPLLTQGRLQRDLAPAGFGAFAPDGADEEEPTIDLSRGRADSRPAPSAPKAAPSAPRLVSVPPETEDQDEEPATAPAERGVLRMHLREAEKRVQQAERSLERRAAAVQAAREVHDDLERRASAARDTLRAAEDARAEAEALLVQEEASRRAAAAALERALGGADSGKRAR